MTVVKILGEKRKRVMGENERVGGRRIEKDDISSYHCYGGHMCYECEVWVGQVKGGYKSLCYLGTSFLCRNIGGNEI